MYRFIIALVSGLLVGNATASAFQVCPNLGCKPQYAGSPHGFIYTMDFKADISPALTDEGKESARGHSYWAKDQWNRQFEVRRVNYRITYIPGTTPPSDGVKVFVTDLESTAHWDNQQTPHLITLAPNYARPGQWTDALKRASIMHEFGHEIGFTGSAINGNGDVCVGLSIMAPTLPGNGHAEDFTGCDLLKFTEVIGKTDEDGDNWSPEEGDCADDDASRYPTASTECTDYYNRGDDRDCTGVDDWEEYGTCPYSPVILDLAGNGFSLTNAANGVIFDLDGDGHPGRIPWTAAGSDDAWLVLDRNGNEIIDSGLELFGNFTAQPASTVLNGFAALAVFDQTAEGGSGDGWIDAKDTVFTRLRLWKDSNHDGVSQAGELQTLAAAHVDRLSLDYQSAERSDSHGNWFRFRARVIGNTPGELGPFAFDVFLGGRQR